MGVSECCTQLSWCEAIPYQQGSARFRRVVKITSADERHRFGAQGVHFFLFSLSCELCTVVHLGLLQSTDVVMLIC